MVIEKTTGDWWLACNEQGTGVFILISHAYFLRHEMTVLCEFWIVMIDFDQFAALRVFSVTPGR